MKLSKVLCQNTGVNTLPPTECHYILEYHNWLGFLFYIPSGSSAPLIITPQVWFDVDGGMPTIQETYSSAAASWWFLGSLPSELSSSAFRIRAEWGSRASALCANSEELGLEIPGAAFRIKLILLWPNSWIWIGAKEEKQTHSQVLFACIQILHSIPWITFIAQHDGHEVPAWLFQQSPTEQRGKHTSPIGQSLQISQSVSHNLQGHRTYHKSSLLTRSPTPDISPVFSNLIYLALSPGT